MSGAPRRVHLAETGSTNDVARELAAAGAPDGTVVTARAQTAGRGRQGRAWAAPPGRALLCSIVVRDPPDLLPLAGAIAAARAVERVRAPTVPGRTAIKWPNDVVLADVGADGAPVLRKVAGLLAEGRPAEGWAVLGVGMNVAVRAEDLPADVAVRAGTLGREPGAVEEALDALRAALEPLLRLPGPAIRDAWARLDALDGARVRWTRAAPGARPASRPVSGDPRRAAPGRSPSPDVPPSASTPAPTAWAGGVARGIDAEGRLRVRGDDGRIRTLDAADVHLAPPA